VRAVVCLAPVLLASCSTLLGIQDPSPGDAGPIDAAVDGGNGTDRLTFRFGDFAVAQGQAVQLHVTATHADGGMEDVTATATYTTDNMMVATVPSPGVLHSGTQAGTAAVTVHLGDATATLTVTVTAVACHPVINELQAHGVTSAADEWVEVYNPCTTAINVDGWTLKYRGASTVAGPDSALLSALAGQMEPGELRLFAGEDYQGPSNGTWMTGTGLGRTDGAVGLRSGPMADDPIVDAVAYGAVTPGHPFREANAAPTMVNARSASRLPFDGRDTNNGTADFMIVMTPTPRALNAP
jgi:hypothetical protein